MDSRFDYDPAPGLRAPEGFDGMNAAGARRAPMGGPDGRGLVAPMPVPDKFMVVPGLSALASGTNGGLSGDLQVTWRESGLVIALALSALDLGFDDQAKACSNLGIQIAIQPSTEALFTNGNTAAYVPFSVMNGGQIKPLPVLRYVKNQDIWTVNLRNLSATSYTPIVGFWFRKLPPKP
jgi:hypothetical protein